MFVQGIRALDTLSPYMYYELLVELEGVIWCVWKSVDWSLYIFHLCKVAVYSVSVLEQYDKQVKELIERLDISFRIYNVI